MNLPAARTHPSELEELDFSSGDIDDTLNKNVDFLLRLKDSSLQMQYARFSSINHTLSSLFSLNSLLAVYCLVFIASAILSMIHSDLDGIVPRVIFLILLISVNFYAWRMYFHQTTAVSRFPVQYVKAFQIIVYFALNTVICSRLIAVVWQGPCDDGPRRWMSDWNCNPMGNSQGLPGGATIVAMLLPIMYSISARGAHFEFALGLWLETMLALIASCIIGKLYYSIFFVTYYSFCSLLLLVEARKLHYYLFFTNLKLQETLHDRGKAADAANALEMRHMIANIAHDLKTVRCCLLSLSLHLHYPCVVLSRSSCPLAHLAVQCRFCSPSPRFSAEWTASRKPSPISRSGYKWVASPPQRSRRASTLSTNACRICASPIPSCS